MTAWWSDLSTLEQFFYYIAIPSTMVLVIQFIMSLMGLTGDSDVDVGDMDGDIDLDADVDMDVHLDTHIDMDGHDVDHLGSMDFRFVSFRTIIAFLTIFSWTGIVLVNKAMNTGLAIAIAVLAGLVAMAIIASLFYFTARLQSSGNISYSNAIGAIGEVYIPIGSDSNSQGKVQVMIQDRLVEANAVSKEGKSFATGDFVKVIGIIGASTLVVDKNK